MTKSASRMTESTPVDTPADAEEEKKMLPIDQTEKPVNVKKEIVKDIITKKKGCGFYDIH